jgi:hypothetical protein
MLKRMLLTGLVLVPSLVSAGLWEDLHKDEATATRIEQLKDSEKDALRLWCQDRDLWQQESTEKIVAHAQGNPEGVMLFQQVTNAAEIRVVCDLICLPPQGELSQDNYPDASAQKAEHHEAEHHEHA